MFGDHKSDVVEAVRLPVDVVRIDLDQGHVDGAVAEIDRARLVDVSGPADLLELEQLGIEFRCPVQVIAFDGDVPQLGQLAPPIRSEQLPVFSACG
jgi:hypothetical protein